MKKSLDSNNCNYGGILLLKEKVLELIGNRKDHIGLVVKSLDKDKFILKLNENKTFQSASIIKIPIMVEALRQVEEGKYSLDQMIEISDRDKVAFSIITELNVLEYSILDLITLMIIISDNTATNILIDLLGYDSINNLIESLNLSHTKLSRKMMDFQAIERARKNTTSPIDMAKILEKLYRGEILSKENSKLAIDIMKRQLHRDAIGRYLPEDIIIANKTGSLDGLNHDIGIVYSEKATYMIGVFVEKGVDNKKNKRLIGNISKLVYDYFQ